MSPLLTHRTAVITDGANRLRSAIAQAPFVEATNVVVRDVEGNVAGAAALKLGHENRAREIPCDVTSESDIDRSLDFATSACGGLDIRVNNAGVTRDRRPGRWTWPGCA